MDKTRTMARLKNKPLEEFILGCASANETMQRGDGLSGHAFNAIMTLYTFSLWMEANGFAFNSEVAKALAELEAIL